MLLRRLLPALALTTAIAGFAACVDEVAEQAEDDLDPGTSNNTSAGESGGSGGSETGQGGGFNPIGSGGGTGGDENCLEESQEAELKGLDMIVVLDRSGSMGSKWDSSVQALTTFVLDPDSLGIDIAMSFYPIDGVDDTCTESHYDPPHVALAELPVDAQTVINAMNAQTALGPNTPTYGALYGTYNWAVAHQDATPERKTVVVFASDGQPNGCVPVELNQTPAIAGLSASAYNYNSVETYVIAIQGANLTQLNEIAKEGGTGQAFDVTANINAFADKMKEIREQALGCEYIIPEPEEGQPEFEATKVNVEYAPGGGSPFDLPQADDLTDCAGAPGWYYDDPINPTKVILCPASCATVETDGEAKISLKFGCPTKMN